MGGLLLLLLQLLLMPASDVLYLRVGGSRINVNEIFHLFAQCVIKCPRYMLDSTTNDANLTTSDLVSAN
jgi:hypothetical protein